jgi:hypothetical protein
VRFKPTFSDVLVGLPAGLLIVVGTALFSTLLSKTTGLDFSNSWVGLLILAFTAFITGLIAGRVRMGRGPATALAAGSTAALILMALWLSARPGDAYNRLVIGLPGMFLAVLCCVPGGFVGASMRMPS